MSDHLNYHALPIDNVVVETTRRPIDEAKVLELMASIQEVGLLNAVLIRTNRLLVAGAHRLEACKRLGWTTIPCKFFERSNKLRAELAEIDENLIRSNPGAAEHAVLTERRAQIIEALAAEPSTADAVQTLDTVEFEAIPSAAR